MPALSTMCVCVCKRLNAFASIRVSFCMHYSVSPCQTSLCNLCGFHAQRQNCPAQAWTQSVPLSVTLPLLSPISISTSSLNGFSSASWRFARVQEKQCLLSRKVRVSSRTVCVTHLQRKRRDVSIPMPLWGGVSFVLPLAWTSVSLFAFDCVILFRDLLKTWLRSVVSGGL